MDSLDNYEITEISKSCYSISLARDKTTGQMLVLKDFLTEEQKFNKEKLITTTFNSQSILRSFGSIPDTNILKLEHAEHGDLFDILEKGGRGMDPDVSRVIFHGVLNAIEMLHQNGLAHLDIKLENVLMNKDLHAKVCDFEQVLMFDQLQTSYGTPQRRAPEVANGNCQDFVKADIFSLGVLLFMLVIGYPPFDEKALGSFISFGNFYKCLHRNPKAYWVFFEKQTNTTIADDLKSLLTGMMKESPQERPTIDEIRNNPWCQIATDIQDYKEKLSKFLRVPNE
jgi:serine/threonine protein kinase